jgi:two-component system LytT family sensor kinase
MITMRFGRGLTWEEITAGGFRGGIAIAMAGAIWWLVRRVPWPRPFRFSFVLMHVAAWFALGFIWCVATNGLIALAGLETADPLLTRLDEYLLLAAFVYVFVAGSTYAATASARAAKAEATVARAEAIATSTQLAALRAQLHPHFLFNALHTVVQLIPMDPAKAAEAAEMVAGLLRTSIGEQRDEVLLDDEWEFVSRYLAVEQIRFGDRLRIRSEIPPDLLDERVPSFALQTLVENAVQHGATPRVAPTEIVVSAAGGPDRLTLAVRNTGDSGDNGDAKRSTNGAGSGTGLTRLRERLAVLYGGAATLTTRPLVEGGYEAVLVVPLSRGSLSRSSRA